MEFVHKQWLDGIQKNNKLYKQNACNKHTKVLMWCC